MRLALEWVRVARLMGFSDSKAAIAAVKNPAAGGCARTAEPRAVVDLAGGWVSVGTELRFRRVKAHVGIVGNARADKLA